MPPVYLLKFRQYHLPLLMAHWAIFLPYSSTRPSNQPPGPGILYHASSEWNSCFPLLIGTRFEALPGYNPSTSSQLFDYFAFNGVDLSNDDVSASCTNISAHRNFTFVNQNCQEWVKEVVKNLINRGLLVAGALEEMRGEGYVSMGERCDDCMRNNSSSLCNKCRRTQL